jgi:hypothetical protein
MTEEIVPALIKELQPFFYAIGAFTLIVFTTFGGGILKIILDAKKDRDKKLDVSIESLKGVVIENTNAIIRLELKLDMKTEKHEKDLKNLGMKIKSL